MTGEALGAVKDLPSLAASTRTRKRVATGWPPLLVMYFSSVLGSLTVSFLAVLTSALTNSVLPPSARNCTLFLALPRLKFLPVIVSLAPT